MRRVILALCWLGAAVVGCGSAPPRAVSAVAGLPEYTPDESAIFGDTLSAPVFGLPAEIPPADDPKLVERTGRAETIVEVRVATVTQESLAGVRGCYVSVVAVGAPIIGRPPDGPIDLHIENGNPSLSRVQAMGNALMGRKFLLFMRIYDDQGERTLHFHGEADLPEVRKAIDSAMALDQKKTPGQNPGEKTR